MERVLAGGTDEEILARCFEHSRRPTEEEIETWNGFLAKRGWRDDTSERLATARQSLGLGHRTDLQSA